jgi:4-amino-4-deoxy-L-arabinose transferase-like glycosyltransferase
VTAVDVAPTRALVGGAGPAVAQTLDRALPWLVVGAGLLLRLAALDLAPFTYDDADLVLRARAAASGALALTGAQTSWGVPDPPLQVYLAVPVAWLPNAALLSVAYFALINGAGVAGFYWVGRRFFGRRLALLATLLLAVNPWALYFGRRAWLEVQPALTLLAFWAALELVVAGRRRLAFLFFLALAAGVQVRLLAAGLAPAAVAALGLGGRAWWTRWSALGLVGGGLLSLPYGWYLFSERERVLAILAEGERGVSVPRTAVVEFTWWVTAGLNLLPTPPRLLGWLDWLGLLLRLEAWLAAALLLGGALLALFSIVRRRPRARAWALVLGWVMLPLLFIAGQRSTPYLHYAVLVLPAIFLLPALTLDQLWRLPRVGRGLGPILLTALVLPQLLAWLSLERTLAIFDPNEANEASLQDRRLVTELGRASAQLIGTGESYGVETPLRIWQAVLESTQQAFDEQPRQLLVVADGTNPAAEAQPAVLEAFLAPRLRPRYLAADALVLPLGQPSLLLLTSDVDPAAAPERLGSRRTLVPLPTLGRGTRDGVRLFELPARTPAELSAAVGAVPPSSVAPPGLVGLALPPRARVGETLLATSVWVGPRQFSRPTLTLLDGQGQRLAEREVGADRLIELGAGEALVLRHSLILPARAAGDQRIVLELGGSDFLEVGTTSVAAR